MVTEAWRRLSSEEAVPLGYAMVDSLSRRSGVRALALKGPIADLQRLRPPNGSIDVDMLCDPDAVVFERLTTALVGQGWTTSGFSTSPFLYPEHSITFRHPLWPIEIDLHRQFPGLLADPDRAFETLWADRTEVTLAGRSVLAPSTTDHLLILALHVLRDGLSVGTQEQLQTLVAHGRRVSATSALRERAMDLGAATAAAPLFVAEGVAAPPDPHARPDLLRRWELRVRARSTEVTPWILEFANPTDSRWRILLRAIWPSRHEIARHDADAASRRLRRLVFRLRRLVRGLAHAPSALRDVRAMRRRRD